VSFLPSPNLKKCCCFADSLPKSEDTINHHVTPVPWHAPVIFFCFVFCKPFWYASHYQSLYIYTQQSTSYMSLYKLTMIYFDRQETICLFHLFTREGDMEFMGCGNTEHKGLKARVLPGSPSRQAMSELCVEPQWYGEQPNAIARQLNLCYIFI
jgi:hypothetical protein